MTHVETAISAALGRAGLNTAQFRMIQAARDALKKHHQNTKRALSTFKRLIDCKGSNELVDAALMFVLKELSVEGQKIGDLHSPSALGRQPTNDGRDHSSVDNQHVGVAPSSRGGSGQRLGDAQSSIANPLREPSPAERAASASVAKRISVLDTFKIAGRAIGDWSVVSAKREGEHLEFHGRVLLELTAEAERNVANIESWMTFRDVLTEHQIQCCIQRASGVSHAA